MPQRFILRSTVARRFFCSAAPAVGNVKTTLNPFVDAARAQGVGHVVFLSVAGAESNPILPHHAVEAHLAARSDDWTVLRPGFFAQNLGDAYRRDVVEDDRLYVPAGNGRVAFVDVRDVGEVAAAALGRTIRYERSSIAGYALHLRRRGMPAAQVAVQTILHIGLRFGQAEKVDSSLAALSRTTVPDAARVRVRSHGRLAARQYRPALGSAPRFERIYLRSRSERDRRNLSAALVAAPHAAPPVDAAAADLDLTLRGDVGPGRSGADRP